MEMSFPSRWKTSCPQPTPQKGQMERATCAPSCFGRSAFVRSLMASTPVPSPPDFSWRMSGHLRRSSASTEGSLCNNRDMADRSGDWMAQAERDLDFARTAARDGFHEWACFVAQQAAEKG